MKVKLVPDWKEWYKWWSIWLAAASAAMQGAAVGYASLPSRWQDLMPDDFGYICGVGGIVLAGLVPFARVLQQHFANGASEDDSSAD